MKHSIQALAAAAALATTFGAHAATFTPKFSDYSFPGTQYTVDAAANTFFAANYGITVDNAYLYVDSRDTFDGIGVSTGTTAQFGTTQTARIDFLDTTDFVTIEWWTIQSTTYSAYQPDGTLIDTFTQGANQEGTHTFSAPSNKVIGYVTWRSGTGYGQISGLTYNYDGLTGGGNTDLPPVPEPETYALMLLGLAGLGAVVRRRQQG